MIITKLNVIKGVTKLSCVQSIRDNEEQKSFNILGSGVHGLIKLLFNAVQCLQMRIEGLRHSVIRSFVPSVHLYLRFYKIKRINQFSS